MFEYFERVPDPRVKRSRKHRLTCVLVLSLLAIICGGHSPVAVEPCGKCLQEFLKAFLDLSNGIPSHDTIGRVLSVLSPMALQESFRGRIASLAKVTQGEVVAIGGKTLRRSFRHAGDKAFVHMVIAWATTCRGDYVGVPTGSRLPPTVPCVGHT
jgi:hypothetical protein